MTKNKVLYLNVKQVVGKKEICIMIYENVK